MKLKLIITCFLCSIAYSFAQNSGSIKGKVIDKNTNEPLAYVNIILKALKTKASPTKTAGGIPTVKGIV